MINLDIDVHNNLPADATRYSQEYFLIQFYVQVSSAPVHKTCYSVCHRLSPVRYHFYWFYPELYLLVILRNNSRRRKLSTSFDVLNANQQLWHRHFHAGAHLQEDANVSCDCCAAVQKTVQETLARCSFRNAFFYL